MYVLKLLIGHLGSEAGGMAGGIVEIIGLFIYRLPAEKSICIRHSANL